MPFQERGGLPRLTYWLFIVEFFLVLTLLGLVVHQLSNDAAERALEIERGQNSVQRVLDRARQDHNELRCIILLTHLERTEQQIEDECQPVIDDLLPKGMGKDR